MREPIIKVRDVSVGWTPESVLIEHVNFEVMPGEVFAILLSLIHISEPTRPY